MVSLGIKTTFQDSLINHVQSSWQSDLSEPEMRDFIEYLISHQLIPASTLKIYTVLAEFERIVMRHPEKNKSECVVLLNNQLNLNTSTIWNILKDHKGKFNF